MKIIPSALLALSMLTPVPLLAGSLDTDALLGGALGGGLGAVVGSEVGGRNGAILGGAIGGAAGTAITTRHRRREVIYVDRPHHYHHDRGWHRGHYRHRHRHYDYD